MEDHINIPKEEKIFLLTSDIPQFGIVGDRVIVKHLMNLNPKRYAGIGELADRIAVEHCNKHGIKPVIISEVAYNSHAAHYKRGKRYLYSDENNNPNEIVRKIVEETPVGEQCNTGHLGILISYMPDKLVQQIKNTKRDILRLREMGYDFDTKNPNNILYDEKTKTFNLVDITKSDDVKPEVTIKDFYPFVDNARLEWFYKDSFDGEKEAIRVEVTDFLNRIAKIGRKMGVNISMPEIDTNHIQKFIVYLYHDCPDLMRTH